MTSTYSGGETLSIVDQVTMTLSDGSVFYVQVGAYYLNTSGNAQAATNCTIWPRFRCKMITAGTDCNYFWNPGRDFYVSLTLNEWTNWMYYGSNTARTMTAATSFTFSGMSFGVSKSASSTTVYTSYTRSITQLFPMFDPPAYYDITFTPVLDRRGYITSGTITNAMDGAGTVTLHVNTEDGEVTYTFVSNHSPNSSDETITVDTSEWGQLWLDGMAYTYWWSVEDYSGWNYSYEEEEVTFTFPSIPHGIVVTGLSSNFSGTGVSKAYTVEFTKRSGATGDFYTSSFSASTSNSSVISLTTMSATSVAEGYSVITITPTDEYADDSVVWTKTLYVLGGVIPEIENPVETVDKELIDIIMESELMIETYLQSGIEMPTFYGYSHSKYTLRSFINSLVTNCRTLWTAINNQSTYPHISSTRPVALVTDNYVSSNSKTQWYIQINRMITCLNAMKTSIDSVENA